MAVLPNAVYRSESRGIHGLDFTKNLASKYHLAHTLARSCRNKSPEAGGVLQPLSKQQNLDKLIIWAQQHYAVFHWHLSQVHTVADVAEFCSVQQYIH